MKIDEYVIKIKEKLKEKGYCGKKIGKKEFETLYQKYGKYMKESDFAQFILEINYSQYLYLKDGKHEAEILNDYLSQVIKEEAEGIKQVLVEEGYAGKSIDYSKFKELYQKYGTHMQEKDFAEQVLEITNYQYYFLRRMTSNAVILSNELNRTIENDSEELKKVIGSNGYAGKLIDYGELQMLHSMYGIKLTEVKFATTILEISYSSYIKLKAGERKVFILKKFQEKVLENIEKMKNTIKNNGYAGRLISYEELQTLHRTYGEYLQEYQFAEKVLEFSDKTYADMKNHGSKGVALMSMAGMISEEEIEDIKEKMREDGYKEKAVDYEELKLLHQTYAKQMLERDFAQKVLGIKYNYYINMKNSKKRAVILKDKKETDITEEIIEIKQKIIEQGYAGKSIDYEEFKELFELYGNKMTEREFAFNVLEMTSSQYSNLTQGNGGAKILKKSGNVIFEKEVNGIREKLYSEGYAGKSIDYDEFKALHQKYGNGMSEKIFAEKVLEINCTTLRTNLKKNKQKATILSSFVFEVSTEELDRIKKELEEKGYVGKMIDYAELHAIYLPYSDKMKELQFAQDVLGISGAHFNNLKRISKAKAMILKGLMVRKLATPMTKVHVPDDEIERIQKILEEKGLEGMSINYEKLQEIHKKYGEKIPEKVFAREVLEISEQAYRSVRYGRNTRILSNNRNITLLREINFEESRWYTEEELERLCNVNSVTIDRIISQIASNGTREYNEEYKRVLYENGRIWIGETPVSEKFLEENYKNIIRSANKALASVKRRFQIGNSDDEDLIQEAVFWFAQNRGDVEKNFIDYPDIIRRRTFNSLRRSIMFQIFNSKRISVSTISYNQRFRIGKNGNEKEIQDTIASDYDLEDDVMTRMHEDNDLEEIEDISEDELALRTIEEMKKQIKQGLNRSKVIENTAEKFGLSGEELLEIMQEYLLTNGKVKIENGKAKWTEDSNPEL